MVVSGQLQALVTLLQTKIPWYLLNKWLVRLQSQSECGGEEKNPFPVIASDWALIIHPVA
jgi:hypothetical protein